MDTEHIAADILMHGSVDKSTSRYEVVMDNIEYVDGNNDRDTR